MSFTNYKWGSTRSFRSIWPILTFSSLRTDYSRILQLNLLILKIVTYTFKRLYVFTEWFAFSHTLFKIFIMDKPTVLVEIFFYFKNNKFIIEPHINKVERAELKKKRPKSAKKKRHKKSTKKKSCARRAFVLPRRYRVIFKNRIKKDKFIKRVFERRYRKFRIYFKLLKFNPKLFSLRPAPQVIQKIIRRIKRKRLKQKRKRTKPLFKRYRYRYRVYRTKLIGYKKGKFKFKCKLRKSMRIYQNKQRHLYVYFLRKFLDIFQFSLNIFFAARLVNLRSANINIYMDEISKKYLKKSEANPKSILKNFIRHLKRYRRKLRIVGAKVVAKGRFNRRARVKSVKVHFGRIPLTGKRARIEYKRKDYNLRFGIASINLYIRYAR